MATVRPMPVLTRRGSDPCVTAPHRLSESAPVLAKLRAACRALMPSPAWASAFAAGTAPRCHVGELGAFGGCACPAFAISRSRRAAVVMSTGPSTVRLVGPAPGSTSWRRLLDASLKSARRCARPGPKAGGWRRDGAVHEQLPKGPGNGGAIASTRAAAPRGKPGVRWADSGDGAMQRVIVDRFGGPEVLRVVQDDD